MAVQTLEYYFALGSAVKGQRGIADPLQPKRCSSRSTRLSTGLPPYLDPVWQLLHGKAKELI